MAVSGLDSVSSWANSGSSEYSETYSIGAASDRCLIAACSSAGGNGSYNPTITWGGQSMTRIGSVVDSGVNNSIRVELAAFYLNEASIAAASGSTLATTNANPNFSDSALIARSYQGAPDAGVIDATNIVTDTDATSNNNTFVNMGTVDADEVAFHFGSVVDFDAAPGGTTMSGGTIPLIVDEWYTGGSGTLAMGETIFHSTSTRGGYCAGVTRSDAIAAIGCVILATSSDPVLEQEGFRGRNDDDDEANATWKAAQDVDFDVAPDELYRLRFVVDSTVAALVSKQIGLEHAPDGTTDWRETDVE